MNFRVEHYGTPETRHHRFVSEGKFQDSDPGISEHQLLSKALYFGAVYDQLDLPQLAWAELIGRQFQMIELHYKNRFLPKLKENLAGPDPYDDAHLYLGLSQTRGMLAVSPALEAWIGKELSTEFLALKERRKAFEERREIQKGRKGKKDKDGKDDA